MKTLFPDSMLNTSGGELTPESIAGKLLFFHEELHLLHWQTVSYATHMALGSMYDYVHDFKDGLMEKIMGYTGKKIGLYKVEQLTMTSPDNVLNDLLAFAANLKKYGEANSFHDVCNLADSLSGEAAKCKYLLTLS